MKHVSLLFFGLLSLLMHMEAYAVVGDCPLGNGMKVVKTNKWSIQYAGEEIAVIPPSELDSIFGGKPANLKCDDIYYSFDTVAFVVGHQHDLFLAYGLLRNDKNEVIGISKLHYYPHDAMMGVSNTSAWSTSTYYLTYGRERNYHATLCWNSALSKNPNHTWLHNADHHNGGDCVSDAKWPFSYSNTGEEYSPCCTAKR